MQIEGNPDSNPLASGGAEGKGEDVPTQIRRAHAPLPIERPIDPELQRQIDEMGTDGGWDHRQDEARAA